MSQYNANEPVTFESMFSSFKTVKVATRQNGNTLESAREKVVRSLESSKALLNNKSFTYMKHGKLQRPLPCYFRLPNDTYLFKVLFSRVTLDLPNGANAIECSRDELPDMHDRMIKVVRAGVLDEKIKEAQERYRAAQTRREEV